MVRLYLCWHVQNNMPRGNTEMHSLFILADAIWVPVLQSTRLHTPDPASVSKQDQGCGSNTFPSAQPLCIHSKQEAPRSTPGCKTILGPHTPSSVQIHCHPGLPRLWKQPGLCWSQASLPAEPLSVLKGAKSPLYRECKPVASYSKLCERPPLIAIAAGKTPQAQRKESPLVVSFVGSAAD